MYLPIKIDEKSKREVMNKMEKKPKIQKIKQPKKKIKASSLAFVLLSLVLTIALFFGLVLLQNVLSEKIVYQSVVVAKEEIGRAHV